MCGDKWANIFCPILRPKPRGSCLHWRPLVWLNWVGLMSRRNGSGADRCVSALFVCVLCCGTMVVRPLYTSGHGGVWPRGGRVWGWWESGPGTGEAEPKQRPEDLKRHVLGPLLLSPTPSFSWRPTPFPTTTHVIGYKQVLLIHLGYFFSSIMQTTVRHCHKHKRFLFNGTHHLTMVILFPPTHKNNWPIYTF